MPRLIELLVLGAAIWLLLRTLRGATRPAARAQARRAAEHATKRQPLPARNTVRCAYCGMFVPESDAYRQQERYYCSRQHQEADSKR